MNGLIEVRSVGAGFMLLSRNVFSRIASESPSGRVQGNGIMTDWLSVGARPYLFDYFATRVNDDHMVGEDVGLCAKWRMIGGQVWLDPSIKLTHYGMYAYTGDLMTQLIPRMGETA
jgi:hypothetical protein